LPKLNIPRLLSNEKPIITPSEAKTTPEEPVVVVCGIEIIHTAFDVIDVRKITIKKKEILPRFSSFERKELEIANNEKYARRASILSTRCPVPPPCVNNDVTTPHSVWGDAARISFKKGNAIETT
jgi:hypothetical protein